MGHPTYWLSEEVFDFEPVFDAAEAGGAVVVGRVEEDASAGEALELAGVVVDEVVGAKDAFVAAEDDVLVGMNGKWRPSQRYLALKEVGTSMAAVAMKIS